MRSVRRVVLFVAVLAAGLGWSADKPFLWKLEASGAKPSHLFGSIHIPAPAVTNLAPAVERALRSADAVYCELAFDEPTVLKIAAASMGAKTPLSQALPQELYVRTEAEMRRVVPGFSLAALEKAEVWTVGFALAMLEYQVRYPNVPPLDLLLYQRARAAGLATGGLETPEEQLEAMASFTAAEQAEMLEAALDDIEALRRQGQSPVGRLLAAYRSGSAEAIDREVKRSMGRCSAELQKRFDDALLRTRNRRMAERIAAKMRGAPDRSFFFVVGAMHGLGQGSVIELLTASGVRVERVKE